MTRPLLPAALAAALAAAGCGDPPARPPTAAADPHIRYRESVGGGLGPVNGQRSREYEGPQSKAPDWARPKAPAAK